MPASIAGRLGRPGWKARLFAGELNRKTWRPFDIPCSRFVYDDPPDEPASADCDSLESWWQTEGRLIVRYWIVPALALLSAVCVAQLPREDQASVSDSAATLAPGTPSAVAPARGASGTDEPPAGRTEQIAFASKSADSDSSIVNDESIARVDVVPGEQANTGIVCERVQRPGSRMTRKVCYSRAQQLASQEARDKARNDQLAELEREQRWRDEIIRQAEMRGMRPSGFGLGPN